jgi:signal transduction histidine kinase
LTESTPRATELTAHSSHELRNALACIRQFGSILVDGLAGDMSGEQREYIGIMLENASTIRRVLDSALSGSDGPPTELAHKIEHVSRLGT